MSMMAPMAISHHSVHDCKADRVQQMRTVEYYYSERAKLGHDPLREDADADALWERIKDSKKPIGGILMDQKLIAGVGNIYRAEVRTPRSGDEPGQAAARRERCYTGPLISGGTAGHCVSAVGDVQELLISCRPVSAPSLSRRSCSRRACTRRPPPTRWTGQPSTGCGGTRCCCCSAASRRAAS